MRRFRPAHDTTEMAIANFALTFAKALLVFCVVLFMLINPQQGQDGVKPKAEFLITVDWPGDGRNDVDTWLRLPNGSRINFQNRESGIAYLERDDLGNDCMDTTDNAKSLNMCEEITTLRGIVPGEYVLALHLFSAHGTSTASPTTPVTVTVKIEKLNPSAKTVWQSQVTLDTVRQEKGVVRFTVLQDGSIDDFETEDLPSLVYQQFTQ
jgi:hypothetical protein